MLALTEIFAHEFTRTILFFAVAGTILSGLISLFRKDVENWIVGELAVLLGRKKQKLEKSQAVNVADDDAPACPTCRSVMTKRIARKGVNVGMDFWGCSRFPKCRGTRNIDPALSPAP